MSRNTEMTAPVATPGADAATRPTYFTRRATGLVRDVRVRDAVIFNVLPAAPGYVLAVSVFYILSAFSNVNLFLCILIAAVAAFVVSGTFGLLTQVMPRSGGDYVLISRSLHPALGLGSSLLMATSAILALGYWGVFSAQIGIGPALTMVGVTADSSTLQDWGASVSGQTGSFVTGLILVAGITALLALGTRVWMRAQTVLFGVGMLGLLIAAFTLLTTSRAEFRSAFNDYAQPFTHQQDSYGYFLAQGRKSGVSAHGTDLGNTVIAAGAIMAFSVWSWWSTQIAGEIRQAGTRRTWYAMLGGLTVTLGTLTIMIALLYKTAGHEFLASVTAVSGDPKVYSLPNQPWWITLVSAIHPNTIFVAVLGITFMAWAPLVLGLNFMQPVRALFAWSFDQLVPSKLAAVDRRTHTPVVALALVAAATVLTVYWAAHSDSFFKYVALSTVVVAPTFILAGLSAIVFPIRNRAAYEASSANIRLFGRPLLQLFGVATILVGIYFAWLFLANPELGLPNAGKNWTEQLFTSPGNGGLALCAACLLLGAAVYLVARAWRRTQGIDIDLNYREIPPE